MREGLTLKTATIRLTDEKLAEAQRMAEEQKREKTEVMQEAFEIGLNELRIRYALERYKKGEISFGRLSEITGIPYRELYMELKNRGVHYRYGDERFKEEVRQLVK